ncbi:hypothetical protein D3C86_2119270 [compost metagenome]
MLGLAADNLDMNVVLTGKEETLPYWEVGETLLFFLCQLKYVRKHIDGAGRLL